MAERGSLSHTGENGSSTADRIAESEFPLTGSWSIAENLAFITTTGDLDSGEVDQMHAGLMESASHRANILSPDVSYVGIGLAVGDISVGGGSQEAVFLTENFADTDGQVLVQEEVKGETVIQPYQDGEPVGEPQVVEVPDDPEDPHDPNHDQDEEEDESSSGGGCFVATAAYGDRKHPDVMDLRRFRDEILVGSRAGRGFIRAYRVLGPKMAGLVSHDGVSGLAARALISPMARIAGKWVDRQRPSGD
jgi:hypothetical protein